MRENKFRGKRTSHESAWIYGCLLTWNGGTHSIKNSEDCQYSVDSETVAQFTGKNDVANLSIYGDDIVKTVDETETICVVTWIDQWSMFATLLLEEYLNYKDSEDVESLDDGMFWSYWINGNDYQVIGNIHDNPELLK